MATAILMPKVDMVMETGELLEWLVKEGEQVTKGQPLFVIGTDKSAIEIEAVEAGILAGVSAQPGDVVPISTVIAYLLAPGEELPEEPASSAVPDRAEESAPELPSPSVTVTSGLADKDLLRATPLARLVAREHDVVLADVVGSGPRGRVYRADVERFLRERGAYPLAAAGREKTVATGAIAARESSVRRSGDFRVVRLSGAQKIIAERLTHSARQPLINLRVAANMSAAQKWREEYNQRLPGPDGKLSYTSLIALAVVRCLETYPELNSTFMEDEWTMWSSIHLGLAVDVDDLLVVPVLRDAQNLRLGQLSDGLNDLVRKARERRLLPEEMYGSTFTLTNLGMLRVKDFTAIPNPPEVAILAVGSVETGPWAMGDKIVACPQVQLTLTVNHQVINGAKGARFLADLRGMLEDPYLLI